MNITRNFLMAAASGLFLGLSAVDLHASPRGSSDQGRDYLSGSSESDGWSFGMFFLGRDKNVEIEGFTAEMRDEKLAAYIGRTLLPWITLYGIAGQDRHSFSSGHSGDSEQSFLWGAATDIDLFLHEIQDPVLMENEIRVNINLAYYGFEADALGETRDVGQFDASLTVSLANNLDRVSLYLPETIAIFAGPVFSQLDGDISDKPDDSVGMTVGLEVFHSKRVSYNFRVENFSNVGYAGGLNIRF
ncbi:MAG: hypothetical protein O3B24_11110 [Verrucomicrobia bacterium]|nr:hypothetical protein [Verrucomicrobiota bacterium]